MNLSFNKRSYQIHVASIIVLASVFPASLLFYFDKVGIPRFLILSAISYLFGFLLYVHFVHSHFKDAMNLQLPVMDGKIAGSHQVGFGKSRRFQASISLIINGKPIGFYAKKSGNSVGYRVGSLVQILFNSQKPEDSVLINENPYIIKKH